MGIAGPLDIDKDTMTELELLEADVLPVPHSGESFRLYDTDGEWIFAGLYVGHHVSGIEVLTDFNEIDQSIVEIRFLSGLTGCWEKLVLE